MPVVAMQDVGRELHALQRLQRSALQQQEAPMFIGHVSDHRCDDCLSCGFKVGKGNRFLRHADETARELVALRLNPWWYPHGIYAPANDGTGGPFTIGRVIHSARGVGFTGWIGGVAVFNRTLSAEELAALAALRGEKPRKGGT